MWSSYYYMAAIIFLRCCVYAVVLRTRTSTEFFMRRYGTDGTHSKRAVQYYNKSFICDGTYEYRGAIKYRRRNALFVDAFFIVKVIETKVVH